MRYQLEHDPVHNSYLICDSTSGVLVEFAAFVVRDNPVVAFAVNRLAKGEQISTPEFDHLAQMVQPSWQGESYTLDGEVVIP